LARGTAGFAVAGLGAITARGTKKAGAALKLSRSHTWGLSTSLKKEMANLK